MKDAGFVELLEAANSMTIEEKRTRLAQLKVKIAKLDLSKDGKKIDNLSSKINNFFSLKITFVTSCSSVEGQHKNVSIVEEAAAIRMSLVMSRLEQIERRHVTIDDALSSIVLDVQVLQDEELSRALLNLPNMDLEDLNTARSLEVNSRHWGCLDNVVEVLTRYDGDVTDGMLIEVKKTTLLC